MENINELKKQLDSLRKELGTTKNENVKLSIIYKIEKINEKIKTLEASKKANNAKQEQPQKVEFKKEDKKPEQQVVNNDMNRGKVYEPNPSNNTEDKKDSNNKNEKKN